MRNILLLITLIVLFSHCKKKSDEAGIGNIPSAVTTLDVTPNGSNSIKTGVLVTGNDVSCNTVYEKGVLFSSTNPWPSGNIEKSSKVKAECGNAEDTVIINELLPNTTYYFQAYVKYKFGSNGTGEMYGEPVKYYNK